MRGRFRTDVVEAIRLGDVTAHVLRHTRKDRAWYTARFVPVGSQPVGTIGFQADELEDLSDAALAAAAVIRKLPARVG